MLLPAGPTARPRKTRKTRKPAAAALAAGVALLLPGCQSPLDEARRASIDFRNDLLRDFRVQVESSVVAPASQEAREREELLAASVPDPAADPAVWWTRNSLEPVFDGGRSVEATLDRLLTAALFHSSQVKVFSDLPLIRRTAIAEAEGRFTPRFFAEGLYERSDDPVGSTLQTGGPDRFEEDQLVGEFGIRARTRTGADVTLSERISYVDNNSVFFIPNPQSRALLSLSVVQPLLRGAGTGYNTAILEIAEIDSEAAQEEFVRQASFHLMEVTRAYWNLYLTRVGYLQDRRLADATQRLVDRAEARADLDTPGEVLLRARSALNERQSNLIRTKAAIRNAEDRVKALVNDPDLLRGNLEVVLADLPTAYPQRARVVPAAEAALQNRPEVNEAFLQWRAAAVRSGIADNETLPQLDAIAEVATAGLREAGETGEALGDQFDSDLSFTLGLRFETPIGKSERDARQLRRRLELRSQGNQVKVVIETVLLEVKVGVREVETAWRDLVSRHETLVAAREDTRILTERWEGGVGQGPGGGGLAGVTYLNLLLDAQVRQNAAERAYAAAQATYAVAQANLERVQGTLLAYRGVEPQELGEGGDGLPALRLRKPSPLSDRGAPGAAPNPLAGRGAGVAEVSGISGVSGGEAGPAEAARAPIGTTDLGDRDRALALFAPPPTPAPAGGRRPAPLKDAGEAGAADRPLPLEGIASVDRALTFPW